MSSQTSEVPISPPPYEETSPDPQAEELTDISQTSTAVQHTEFTLPISTPPQEPQPALSSSSSTFNIPRNPRVTLWPGGRLSDYDEESYVREQVKKQEKGKKVDGFTVVMCFGVAIGGILLCCTPLCVR